MKSYVKSEKRLGVIWYTVGPPEPRSPLTVLLSFVVDGMEADRKAIA